MTSPVPNSPDGLAALMNGRLTNNAPMPWRLVHLLRDAQVGDLSSFPDSTAEGPNDSPSMYDQMTTLAKILTRRYHYQGKSYDIFDMIVMLFDPTQRPQ